MITVEALDILLRVQNLRAFQGRMRQAQSSIRGLGRAARSESASTSAAVLAAGKKATLGLAAIAAGTAMVGFKMSVEFEKEMTLIQTQAGRSREEVAMLTDEVLKLAEESSQSPVELARALFGLSSTGVPTDELMRDLKVAADGAAVGLADVEDTTNALTGAWLAGIEGGGSFEHTMAVLNATVGAGNMRMQDLVTAMGTGVLPASKNFGLSLQDVMGALALLTDEGYGAYGAMAQFATALHFIGAPTEKARKAMKQMGLDELEIANVMREEGMIPALTLLQDTIKNFSDDPSVQTDMLSKILPGGRGRVILTLMNQLDRYRQKVNQISDTTNEFGDAVERTHETSVFKLKAAWSGLQVELIKLGDVIREHGTDVLVFFIGVATALVHVLVTIPDIIRAITDTWDGLPGIVQASIAVIAIFIAQLYAIRIATAIIWFMVAAWRGLAYAILVVRGAMTLLFLMSGPLGWILLATSILILLMIKHWGWVKQAAVDAWSWIKQAAQDTWRWLVAHFWGARFVQMIIDNWDKIQSAISRFWRWLKTAASNTADFIVDRFREIYDFVKGVYDFIRNAPTVKVPGLPGEISAGSIAHSIGNSLTGGLLGLTGGWTGGAVGHGGAMVVGERGPEVAFFPSGTQLVPSGPASIQRPTSDTPPRDQGWDNIPYESTTVIQVQGRELARVVSREQANRKARR